MLIILVRETYLYIITTITTAESYKEMFKSMFHWLGTLGGYTICWHHIKHMHNKGNILYAITCDMDTKQARGKL